MRIARLRHLAWSAFAGAVPLRRGFLRGAVRTFLMAVLAIPGSLPIVEATAAGPGAVLVDGVAATYGGRVITVQDVYLYRALMRLVEGKGDPLELESGERLQKTTQRVLFEALVQAELEELADKGKSFGAPVGILAAMTLPAIRQAGRRAALEQVLKRFGRSEAYAEAMLERHRRVEDYLVRKLETLTPVLTEAELRRFFEKQARKGTTFEQARPLLERRLKEERRTRGLEEWARYLRDKYQATNLVGKAPS